MRVHRTPFRPLWTELKGFGSTATVAGPTDGVHDCRRGAAAIRSEGRPPGDVPHAARGRAGRVVGRLRAADDRGRRVPDPALAGADERRACGADHDRRRRHAAAVLAGRDDARSSSRRARARRSPGSCRSTEGSRSRWPSSRARPARPSGRPTGRADAVLAESGEDRFRVGDPEKPTARRIADLNWRLDGVGIRDQFTSLWVVPARGGKPKQLTGAGYEAIQPFWSPDGRRIGYLADPRPEAGAARAAPGLVDPRRWRARDEARGARGRDRRRSVLAGRKARVRRPRRSDLLAAATNIGLWVKEGSRTRRLGEELDRTFLFIVIGDLVDFGALAPVPRALARRREPGRPGHRPRSVRAVPLRAGRLRRAPRRARRRRLHVARARRRAPGNRCEHRRRRVRRLRRRGRRPAQALAERRLVVRPLSPRSGAPCGAGTGTDTRSTRGSSVRGAGRSKGLVLQIHGGPHCAHGPAPWLEMVALADAGFTVLYGNPRGSVGYGEAFAKAIEGNWGEADDVGPACASWTGRSAKKLGDARPHRPARALVRRLHDELAARTPPGPVRGGREREPRPRSLLVLRGVRLRVHDRRARGRRRRALGQLPADAREVARRALCIETRRRSSSSRPRATCAVPRARPRSRSRCSAASAGRSRWCATRTSST